MAKRSRTPARRSKPASRRTAAAARVRYAVVGLGHISQAAVLPAFAHARANSELVALVSDEPEKLRKLSRRYRVPHTYDYDHYEECLRSGAIDAVYVALPNHLHCAYTIRAALAGVHVLCEKPMAVTEEECERMIRAAGENSIRLMIGYRLHFEAANLAAIELLQKGAIGEPRIFQSTFTMQVRDADNIRLKSSLGGGVLYDIGIYCINAARYLFRDEPTEAFAWSANSGDPRFAEVDEMVTAMLRFPQDRLACFTASFGAADVSSYRVVGTRGDLCVEPAYEYAEDLAYVLTVDGKQRRKVFRKRDQFGAELLYFSDCIRAGRAPEPDGAEGLADVRIVRALMHAEEAGRPMALDLVPRKRPEPEQEIHRPPVAKPRMVGVKSPSES